MYDSTEDIETTAIARMGESDCRMRAQWTTNMSMVRRERNRLQELLLSFVA